MEIAESPMRYCPRCAERYDDLALEFCSNDGAPLEVLAAQPEAPDGEALVGTVIDGRYRVERMIGEGGMGLVFLVTHTAIGKKLALKILRADMAKDPEVVQRFIQEAQSATSIGHENIVDISDFGKLPDGAVYFVMEYLDGEPLTKLIERGGSFPARDALAVVRQIASALGAAHALGIVHRDLKPDNVYVLRRGEGVPFVKVLDFGIAKVAGSSSKLTRTGMIFGTPHYMSPEQAGGQTVDARTDVYALGVIMYELFTGHVPFDGEGFMNILTKQMFEPPPPFSTYARRNLGLLEEITMKALRKAPNERYASMAEFTKDLERITLTGTLADAVLSGDGSLADVIEAKSHTEMRMEAVVLAETNRAPFVAALVLGVLGLLGVVGWMALGSRKQEPQQPVVAARPPAPPPVPAPQKAVTPPRTLALTSTPPGAEVLVGGAIVGTTPMTFPIPEAGERLVELKLAGHAPKNVLLSQASPETLSVQLEPDAPVAPVPDAPSPRARARRTPRGGNSNGSELFDPWAN
jgi:tRNA A-37 threonylcarbamoyl transferase component Bud32